ncbi:MAG: hypothetical protein ACXIT4_02205 [Erythrobacter sp.]
MKQAGPDSLAGLRDIRGALAAGLLAVIAATALAAPLAAAPDMSRINWAAERAVIARFQDHDQRLQDVGWRLVRGNAAFCPRTTPSIGLQLQDMASYGSPEVARATLELAGDFAVQTVAAGSPADQAGGFARNREIIRLGRLDPNQWDKGRKMDWHRVAIAHNHIDSLLMEQAAITVGFADGGEARIEPVTVCATRFELMGTGTTAVADGNRVVIGMDFPAFDYDEAVFAGVVAHELAHNLLGHAEWLDRNRRTWGNVRRTEREADRLMPWLLANAGYDPAAAVEFMREWGSRHSAKFLRLPTHDGWTKRARAIAAELPRIEAALASEGRADWSRHFERGIDPDKGL